ncbi:DeoR/GlpR family transcriptional regulator [Mergibacter septicus]|uniref:DeoR/GlpR family transcriptional regulator n=1 Tax=Mergibacter septicus TaxID=221402 RepID=A0A8E3SC17_9PAST|nr:DeoR/GlpR family transcriptional regulator [Mergibacter septicus]AWX15803.1 DeoR/GlpR family transcriptional regulator [Mergibacter septicus]QDJ13281.1 DeoR/GlpR family transcriptional regulator [Mergibacter septicus]QDJ15056.1 DeoR/GlpR family transcriptional regulator [Mergibacter septicus]UTU47521.1 DeoR/GlpR family transcriptional regulator [Mergibacter septicus]WMR95299.1 DeoR/GlpR family transcriptional regulator [Mergibacter septicus]
MKQVIRHNKIIELVKLKGYVSTEELVEELHVSPQTIRRDLNELAENNAIRRHHGGAASPSSSENSDYLDRKTFFSAEKKAIAQAVAATIPNGSSLFIDIGTTPEAVAYALLQHQNLRIVTNNLNAAHILMAKKDFKIIIAGGGLRSDGGIIGEATVNFISQFRLDFGVLGISAIDGDGSLLDYDYHEVQVKRAIIESSRTSLLVADHSKFSRNAMVRLGSVFDLSYLFTDQALPQAIQEKMHGSKLQVQICPLDRLS